MPSVPQPHHFLIANTNLKIVWVNKNTKFGYPLGFMEGVCEVSGRRLEGVCGILTSFLCSNFLITPLEVRLAPSKIMNFGVSAGCLWRVWEVSGGVKHCLDSVWAEGFLPVFFIIVS